MLLSNFGWCPPLLGVLRLLLNLTGVVPLPLGRIRRLRPALVSIVVTPESFGILIGLGLPQLVSPESLSIVLTPLGTPPCTFELAQVILRYKGELLLIPLTGACNIVARNLRYLRPAVIVDSLNRVPNLPTTCKILLLPDKWDVVPSVVLPSTLP